MRVILDYVGGCACIIVALATIMAVMVGSALLLNVVIGDYTAASVAGLAFAIGLATPIFNNVIRFWARLARNDRDVPLSESERIEAKQQMWFYLIKVSFTVLVIVGISAFGPQMGGVKVNNRVLTGIVGFGFGILGIIIGYRSLLWTLRVRIAPGNGDDTSTP